MTVEQWPNAQALYVADAAGSEVHTVWQRAIEAAIEAGTLQWSRTLSPSVFDLSGGCPRCGHWTSQAVHFTIILGIDPVTDRPAITNFVCDCSTGHEGQPDGKRGCGWALLPSVTLAWPTLPLEGDA